MKVFISQKMNGLTDQEILARRREMIQYIEKEKPDAEIVDSFFTDYPVINGKDVNIGLKYLAKSIDLLAECKAAYFEDDYDSARGCLIEHECAKAYGIEVHYVPRSL